LKGRITLLLLWHFGMKLQDASQFEESGPRGGVAREGVEHVT
jgi:hypothetical protein